MEPSSAKKLAFGGKKRPPRVPRGRGHKREGKKGLGAMAKKSKKGRELTIVFFWGELRKGKVKGGGSKKRDKKRGSSRGDM